MSEGTDASDVSLASETAKATAAKFSMAAIGFVGTIIFARELGPERFGAYYLLFSLVKIADLPIEGWSVAAKKRFSEEGTKKQEVVGAQYVFALGWVTIGVLGAVLAGPVLVSYTSVAASVPLFIAVLSGEALYVSAERLLQARGLVGRATWIDAIRSYITFAFQLVLILAGWGVAGMAYGLAAASLLVTPAALYFIGVRPTLPTSGTLASQWEYARYSLPSALFGRVYERFDVLLLGYLLGPTAAGWYEVAYKLVTPAKFVANTASSGLMARVSALTSRGKKISEDVTNVLSYASILSVPIFFGALLLAEPLIVTVYGQDYAPATTLLVVIALYHIVMTQNTVLTQTLYGLDLPHQVLWISVVAVLINVILGFALVPVAGPVGVAVGTLAAEILILIILTLYLRNIGFRIQFFPKIFQKQILSGIGMIGLLFGLSVFKPIEDPLILVLYLISGAAIYFLILIRSSGDVRETVYSVFKDIRIR